MKAKTKPRRVKNQHRLGPKLYLQLGRVIPATPLGVLGGFITQKLREYVEPERAGTPKGEPIGLSKRKFHAALLSLTSVGLHQVAKEVGVSYGVLRIWRTEEIFLKTSLGLILEFTQGPFIKAVSASMELFLDPTLPVKCEPGVNADSAQTHRLAGFDDAKFYAAGLTRYLLDEFGRHHTRAMKAEVNIFAVLDWARPLVHILRSITPQRAQAEHLRRVFVILLAQLQSGALQNPSLKKYWVGIAYPIGLLIRDVLKD